MYRVHYRCKVAKNADGSPLGARIGFLVSSWIVFWILSAALKHITVMCTQSTRFTDSVWSMLSRPCFRDMRALLKKLKAEQSALDKKEGQMYSKAFQRMAQAPQQKQPKTAQV